MANEQVQPGTAGPTNPANPNAPILGLGPSLVQTGITMMASGMADDGTITPGSAQALQQMGQGIAFRMQDRWWKQEFENFQSTKGAEVKMQAERTRDAYNLKLQEAGKISDPMMRMQAMNETHGWAVDQMASLDQQYLDMAAAFPNNPYIGQSAGQLLEQRRQQWAQLAAGPQQSAETVAAQEGAKAAGVQGQLAQEQLKTAPVARQLVEQQVETEKAQQERLRAEAGYYEQKGDTAGMTALDKVMPQVMQAGSLADKISIITQTPKGKETLDSLSAQFRKELKSQFATHVDEYNKLEKAITDAKTPEAQQKAQANLETATNNFFNEYGMYPDEAIDDGKAQYDLFEARNLPRIQEMAIESLQSGYASKVGVPYGRGPAAPSMEAPEPAGSQPTEAAKAWGVTETTPEKVSQKVIALNQNVQDYFERLGEEAPTPFDPTQMDTVLAETGRSYNELVSARPGKPLPVSQRAPKVRQLAAKAKEVLALPDDTENRDYRINKGLLHLAVQYSRAVGKPRTVDQFLEEALSSRGMSMKENKARVTQIKTDLKDVGDLLADLYLPGDQRKRLMVRRDDLMAELDYLGAAPKGGLQKLISKMTASDAERQRQGAERQKKLKRLIGE